MTVWVGSREGDGTAAGEANGASGFDVIFVSV
jgi:hypothetical protein